ncbi:MAG TPA: DUF5602 domain-containing protein [Pusillimonas sp.]|uniref:DUF5602 domain-containing protein n=1 Tax=Pusillimonas sp. TaxID=3040095 RepID=UPI002BC2F33C|nr:DUF5602 domain-containing protein [Pusillimonas sp.]HUH87450.1 DUF5602 domain-containing protein [Pusillimonas sp.]
MNKPLLFLGATVLALAPVFGAYAHPPSPVAKAPPTEPYKEVSSLVKLPSFIPGMGQLFVDPKTLPAGPFLAYDHDGKLVSTIYMIPLAQMTPQMHLDDLLAPGGQVDHVDMMYNAGHPGVAEPHIHVVMWHVPVSDEARVAK